MDWSAPPGLSIPRFFLKLNTKTIMAPKSRNEAEAEVRSWGFPHVFTWTDSPWVLTHLSFHSTMIMTSWQEQPLFPAHAQWRDDAFDIKVSWTKRVLLWKVWEADKKRSGKFTVCYPSETPDKKETFGQGARIDVAKGLLHEVWIGDEGCTYVIGE